MRPPPIRFVISLLLLLGVLNAVVFGAVALLLWGALQNSPSAERLEAVRSFDAQFNAVHGRVLAIIAQAARVPDDVFPRLDAGEKSLEPLGADAETVHEELTEYRRSLEACVGSLKKGGSAYVELVNFLLVNAIERGASDIHMEPEPDGMRVRFRIDGLLREVLLLPDWTVQPISTRIKVIGRMDVTEHRRPQDGRTTANLGNRAVDLRLSTVPSRFGESVVIRILDSRTLKVDLGALGWNPTGLSSFFHLVSQTQGLFLVCGPTGSGKTTTLYACINRLKSEASSIVTVEDPIEHTIAGVRQVQVDNKSGLTFASVARSVLRQDPNVMVIGEIRDADSASAAVDAATTGHLVLSTLHTGNSIAAITRLRDLEVPNYLAGHALIGVVAQRLVRRVCPECALVEAPSDEDWERIGMVPRDLGPKARAVGPGCPTCSYAGYSGRVGVFEILRLDDTLRQCVVEGRSEAEMWREARARGFVSLMDDALAKVAEGVTTLEEVARVVPVDAWVDVAPALLLQSTVQARETAPASPPPATAAPAAAPPAGPETPPTAPATPPTAPAGRARPLVLAVDDAEEIRALIAATLDDQYDIIFAADGLEALEQVARHQPDLLALDVMMPHLSGYEVCKRLKDDPRTADIPVLILSARGDSTHVKEGFLVGADDYLPKPFDPEEMELRVRALLRRSGRLVRPGGGGG
jgi:type IV pilus assembly protein PilB